MSFAASVLTRVGRRSLQRGIRLERRCICSTRPAQKQKGKAAFEEAEDVFEDDLFTDPTQKSAPKNASGSASASSSTKTQVNAGKRKLTAEDRAARFNKEFEFVETRLRHPEEGKNAQNIPATTWITLLDVMSTKEQLDQIVELLPLWAKADRAHKDNFAEQLARRCDELGASEVALEVFGDFAQYRVSLSPSAVHSLFHGLRSDVQKLSISAHVAAAHGLEEVVQKDIVNASILAAASLESSLPPARALAKELLPIVKKAVAEQAAETSKVLLELSYGRQKAKWVLQAVESINGVQGAEGAISSAKLQEELKQSVPTS